jgi:tRNA nucleotidyltransferase/poly(A) polymerase
MELCQLHGVKASLTNEAHLVVTLWNKGEAIEHTTFRKESESDGTHCTTEPSSREEDASRRDLSINALYQVYGSRKIIDSVGGIQDLKNKVIRLISSPTYGPPYSRLWEHGGRLFRLARFAAKYKDWTIELNTLEACKKFSPIVFTRGKWESFEEEWAKSEYSWEYLQVLDSFGFLESHGLGLPCKSSFSKEYPWYSLWVSSKEPDLEEFKKIWRLKNETVMAIKDLELGRKIEKEYEWVTTNFRKLTNREVARFWDQSFRDLTVPTQGEVAKEVGANSQVRAEWIRRVKEIYATPTSKEHGIL